MNRNTTTRDRHRNVIRRGKPDCAICQEPIDYDLRYPDPKSFVVDHILPVAHHPEMADELSNKQPAHADCNWAKAAKLAVTEEPRTFITHRTW